MDHLDNGTNKIMAMVIIQSIMTNQACVYSADKVEVLFELIQGLIKDLEGDLEDKVPWNNERPLYKKELNAIVGAWLTLWREVK